MTSDAYPVLAKIKMVILVFNAVVSTFTGIIDIFAPLPALSFWRPGVWPNPIRSLITGVAALY